MTLKIISPDEILFSGEVTQVTLPGEMGEFMVLNNHAALMAALAPGRLKFTTSDGEESTRNIGGGIADIADNIINVCVY